MKIFVTGAAKHRSRLVVAQRPASLYQALSSPIVAVTHTGCQSQSIIALLKQVVQV